MIMCHGQEKILFYFFYYGRNNNMFTDENDLVYTFREWKKGKKENAIFWIVGMGVEGIDVEG